MTAIDTRPFPPVDVPLTDDQAQAMGAQRLDRLRSMMTWLAPQGAELTVESLVDQLGVSSSSVRRDLRLLEKMGVITRTRGGAILRLDSASARQVSPRTARELRHVLARKSAALVPPGPQTVCAIGGLLAVEVARQLMHRVGLTLVTNSLPIAWETARWPGIRPVMLGGAVRPSSLSASGEQAEAALRGETVSTAIIAADALALDGGVMSGEAADRALTLAVARHSHRVAVVVPGSAVGQSAAHQVMPLGKVTDLVTDTRAPAAYLCELAEAGLEVHVASARRTIDPDDDAD